MHRLLQIGFQHAGSWTLGDAGPRLNVTMHAHARNVLYAFVGDGEVYYVGKTTQPLGKRMYGYERPGVTQATNQRNRRLLQRLLEEGVAVELFVLPDDGLFHVGPFHLNLAAGLEDDIIRTLRPLWNGMRTAASEPLADDPLADDPLAGDTPPLQFLADPEDEPAEADPDVVVEHQAAPATFSFVLQPTYARTGFFNVGVAASQHLGPHGARATLWLGNAPTPVLGSINRIANTNHSVRLMGGAALRDYFAQTYVVGDSVPIEVIDPCTLMSDDTITDPPRASKTDPLRAAAGAWRSGDGSSVGRGGRPDSGGGSGGATDGRGDPDLDRDGQGSSGNRAPVWRVAQHGAGLCARRHDPRCTGPRQASRVLAVGVG